MDIHWKIAKGYNNFCRESDCPFWWPLQHVPRCSRFRIWELLAFLLPCNDISNTNGWPGRISELKNQRGSVEQWSNPCDIPWNPGSLMGLLVMAYYDPYIAGKYTPLYNPTKRGVDDEHSDFPMVQRSMPRPQVQKSSLCGWYMESETPYGKATSQVVQSGENAKSIQFPQRRFTSFSPNSSESVGSFNPSLYL